MISLPLLFPLRSNNVDRVNEFHIYELASAIHPLTQIGEGEKDVLYSEVWHDWWRARSVLAETMSDRRPLSVCRPAANKLSAAITSFVPEKWEDVVAKYPSEGKEDAKADYIAWRVREAAKEFETVLAAELQAMDTYLVSQIGSYNTHDLIAKAHISFPESVRITLPEQAKIDFDQSGKCIAFGVYTAAAFHLMRGTETIIRKYYEALVGTPPKPKMRNWGAYQKILEKHSADKKLTDLIEHIRLSYRNPVLHPEENLTSEQVQVLFGVCISAVTLMVLEITRLNLKGGTLAFPSPAAASVL